MVTYRRESRFPDRGRKQFLAPHNENGVPSRESRFPDRGRKRSSVSACCNWLRPVEKVDSPIGDENFDLQNSQEAQIS